VLNKRPLVDNDFYSQFGKRVKRLRVKNHLTQEALSKRLNLSRASIANIELGRQKILLHQLFAVANALKTDPWDLLPMPSDQEDVAVQLRVGHFSKPEIEFVSRIRDLAEKRINEQTTG
jgi:transcriptional regulator with XRE-family HTH domain